MKIQEVSEALTEGGIIFQVPRHLTLKQTPKKAKKINISAHNLHISAQAHRRGAQKLKEST
jgi:hypothetical protein